MTCLYIYSLMVKKEMQETIQLFLVSFSNFFSLFDAIFLLLFTKIFSFVFVCFS